MRDQLELPRALFTPDQVRDIDRRAIEDGGISAYELMCRAGEAGIELLRERWPAAERVLVVCGPGNNGGDGYVVARRARELGLTAEVFSSAPIDELQGAAAQAASAYLDGGGVLLEDLHALEDTPPDVLVDALFGSGLDRPLRGAAFDIVQAIDGAQVPVLAMDVPSGLSALTGAMLGGAVHADTTLCLVGLKRGLFTGQGPACCGELVFCGLQVPEALYSAAPIGDICVRLDRSDLGDWLPARAADTHKGRVGHILVIGGDLGMGGAVRMAAEAALRVGAGRVTVATRSEHLSTVMAGRPELMCVGIDSAEALAPLLDRASVVAIGPGLGTSDWGRDLMDAVLGWDGAVVADADAFRMLADREMARPDWVLTPHPGEAASLLGCSATEVQEDRFAAVREITARTGAVTVLKGSGTLVQASDGMQVLCPFGNPGMASAGMGDVLTGVIAGLYAQIGEPFAAAYCGVLVHALAGDAAAWEGERGTLASDLFPHLRYLVNPAGVR